MGKGEGDGVAVGEGDDIGDGEGLGVGVSQTTVKRYALPALTSPALLVHAPTKKWSPEAAAEIPNSSNSAGAGLSIGRRSVPVAALKR